MGWIFEGIVDWVASTVTDLMDAVSGLFLNALGTDMFVMESYFPFVAKAFTIMQYIAWTLLFLITVWQLFRSFGGPINEAENPWGLILRSCLFAVLIWFAKPIFLYVLEIARAPYTALMDISNGNETFTFAGVENVIKNGVTNFVSTASVVGEILVLILMISLGWNYFKLLLEVVERYVVVGVLCYTSPLAYSMGASKATGQVFKSWCRMVGSQLLLLVMNVWFLRAFNSSVGQYVANGGVLSNGNGSVFLWLFCAIAFLKTAQRFDSYLSSIGLNVAQTGSGLGMELLMATRIVTGVGGGFMRAGHAFGGAGATAGASGGFMAGLVNKFSGNSYVRDAVTQGGQKIGMGGSIGFFGRMVGGVAARNGATLNSNSISSVATKPPKLSGKIGGEIADRSLGNYMPHLQGKNLVGTEILGGKITTNAVGTDGKQTALGLFSTEQFDKPQGPHSVVSATDGSSWYQMASGANAGEFYGASTFSTASDGTTLRTVDDGVISASTPTGESTWYSSAHYNEPDAPHTVMQTDNGLDWYAMQPHAAMPTFEAGTDANAYNQAQFANFIPSYEQTIVSVDGSGREYGHFEVRHEDGSGTAFYDTAQYAVPRGDYKTYEDANGNSWYAIHGNASVERRPVYADGEAVYGADGNVKTVSVETVRYNSTPARYSEPTKRNMDSVEQPRRKRE